MPPRTKFTMEEIVEAAVKITRENGIGAVTAREVGATLGVSSRPLFTYFETVDDLKKEVYLYAKNLYGEYIKKGLKMPIPALGVGQQYLIFARKEPQLYKYLFLNPPEGASGSAILTEFSISICNAYKEIPGLPEGKYDRDAIFMELVKK